MARHVFYSFHYMEDSWRASQIRNMGVIDGNSPASDNDWETIKRGGTSAIERWINNQLHGRSCTIVLIGSQTAGRKWINYEIIQSWNQGKGLLGIYIHNLKGSDGTTTTRGANPFSNFSVDGKSMDSIVPAHDPFPFFDTVYSEIKSNLADWIEEAISIRQRY